MSVQKLSSVQHTSPISIQALRGVVSKKQHEPLWNRLVRKISIYITWLLIHTPINANGVTFLFLLTGLLGAGLYTFGTHMAWIAGTILIWLSIVFDFSDGEVARYRQESSWFGDYYEEIVHLVLVIGMYCGIAVGVWQSAQANPWPFVCALVAAGATLIGRNDKNLLMKSMFQYYGFEKMRQIAPKFALTELALTRNMNRLLYAIDMTIFDFGFYFVMLPLAAIANRMDLFLYFYAAVRALSIVYMFAQSWKLREKYGSAVSPLAATPSDNEEQGRQPVNAPQPEEEPVAPRLKALEHGGSGEGHW
jgi:phosphatidylglycerophosphate synthase